ncbi:hypothetical protein [Glaciihabitans sp. UYNi722]|uniref:hypothetical protein n=1 Tax=Glaciihabitans sp. UYNi722 TaxID=3156344 RepID=UPI00339143A5
MHIASAVLPVIGLFRAAVTRVREPASFTNVSIGLWIAWAVTNVLVVILTLVGAAVRARRVSMLVPVSPADPDVEYVVSTAAAKSRTLVEMEALKTVHATEITAMDEAWRAAIADARRNGRLTARTADHATPISALRWLVEMAADPDFVLADRPNGQGPVWR